MNPLQHTKAVAVIVPVAIVDNTSWTSLEIDGLGFDYLTIYVMLGATDIAMAALMARETDTTGSGQAEITDADFSDTTLLDIDGAALGLPTATDDSKIFGIQLDLRKRKRFIDIVATAGDGTAGTYLVAIALLSRAKEGPSTNATMGCHQLVRV